MDSTWRLVTLLWVALPGHAFAQEGDASPGGPSTLSRALDIALSQSPEVAAARFEVEARGGDLLQARLPDNPEVGVEIENLAARGALAEENQELTASLSQTLDAGRLSRAMVARREKEWARLDLEAVERRVRGRVRKAFVSVLASQDRLEVAGELVSLARRAHGAAVEKVAAGKAPPTDSLQSFMALSQARIDSAKAANGLASSRRTLAAACGLPEGAIGRAEGRLDLPVAAPAWESVSRRIPESPEWKRSAFGPKVREAELRSEKLARLPPITLEAGVRQVPDKDGRALVAGVSLPLPAWNWNQGAIRAAQARKLKAEAEGKTERMNLLENLAALHGQAAISHQEAMTLRDQILPAAQATFEGAQEAYRVGKFGSLDALNAQRALFEARSRYLDALEAYHSALAELEEWTGSRVASVGR